MSSKPRYFGLCATATLLVFFATPGLAVSTQAVRTDGRVPRIFVSDFTVTGLPRHGSELVSVVPGLVALGISAESNLLVERVHVMPVCRRTAVGVVADSVRTGEQMSEGDLAISGHIVSDSIDLQLEYLIATCGVEGLRTVHAREPERIPWSEAPMRLVAAAEEIVQAVQGVLPLPSVSVADFQVRTRSVSAEMGSAARTGVVGALALDRSFRIEEGQARYTLSGWVEDAGPERVRVAIRVSSTNGNEVVSAEGEVGEIHGVVADAADQVVLVLQQKEAESQLGLRPGSLDALSRARLFQAGRDALSCSPADAECTLGGPTRAAAFFYAAGVQDTRDWQAQALYGRAELARGNVSQAIPAVENAFQLWQAGPNASRSAGAEILNDLARGYRQVGNHPEAIRVYGYSLELVEDQPQVHVMRAESYRALKSYPEALRALTRAYSGSGNQNLLRDAIIGTIQAAEPSNLIESLAVVREGCRADASLQRYCAEALINRGYAFYSDGRAPVDVRRVLSAALELGSVEPRARMQALAVLAALAIGREMHSPRGDGESMVSYPNAVPDSVAHYLGQIASVPADAAPAWLNEWVVRLKSVYSLSRGNFRMAYTDALHAQQVRPTPNAAFVAGLAAYLLARRFEEESHNGVAAGAADSALVWYATATRHLRPAVDARMSLAFRYYRSASHHAGDDAGARTVLQQLVQQNPTDRELRTAILHVCNEYLKDFQCGYALTAEWDAKGMLTSDVDSLGAVETALLAGELAVAEGWIVPLLKRELSACRAAVAAIFHTWVLSASGRYQEMGASFDRWSASHSLLLPGRPPCWVFDGALAALEGPSAPPQAELLTQMIRALLDPAAPLPERPAL